MLQRRQSLVAIAACAVIAAAAVFIFLQARDFASPGIGNAFFSTDDGKTWFVEKVTRIPPFDKDGKPAYRAHVFECGGKRVVGFLSRYTPEAIQALQEAAKYKGTGKPPPNARALASVGTTGMQVKRPGDAQWVSQADMARATAIRIFRCPDGSAPTEVEP